MNTTEEYRQKYWMFPQRFPRRAVVEIQTPTIADPRAACLLECGHVQELNPAFDHRSMTHATCGECYKETFVPEY